MKKASDMEEQPDGQIVPMEHPWVTSGELCVIRYRADNGYNSYALGDVVKRCQAAVYADTGVARSYADQLNGDPVIEPYKSARAVVVEELKNVYTGTKSGHTFNSIADAFIRRLTDEGVLSDSYPRVITETFDERGF